MTKKEILEGNKLIAEFMGGKVVNNVYFCNNPATTPKGGSFCYTYEQYLDHYNIGQAKYDSSWDWLMPVVEKIKNICIKRSKIFLLKNRIPKQIEGDVFEALLKVDINVLYLSTINFIKWYNENTK